MLSSRCLGCKHSPPYQIGWNTEILSQRRWTLCLFKESKAFILESCSTTPYKLISCHGFSFGFCRVFLDLWRHFASLFPAGFTGLCYERKTQSPLKNLKRCFAGTQKNPCFLPGSYGLTWCLLCPVCSFVSVTHCLSSPYWDLGFWGL